MELEILTICMECKGLKINLKPEMWLREEIDTKLYNQYLEKYKGKLSHGYCSECFSKS